MVEPASLAEKPVLTDAPSMHPANTAIEQKRPNAINSSPAENHSTRVLRVETATQRLKTRPPCPTLVAPGFVIPQGVP